MGGPDSYAFFNDDSWQRKIQVLQWVKESGLCYIHAPVVLQSDLISWNFQNAEYPRACEMLDIRRYILENFSSIELQSHIISTPGQTRHHWLSSNECCQLVSDDENVLLFRPESEASRSKVALASNFPTFLKACFEKTRHGTPRQGSGPWCYMP